MIRQYEFVSISVEGTKRDKKQNALIVVLKKIVFNCNNKLLFPVIILEHFTIYFAKNRLLTKRCDCLW